MAKENQSRVIALLRASSSGVNESDLKSAFQGKNFKKIVSPMLARGEIIRNPSGIYSINPVYSAPAPTRHPLASAPTRTRRKPPFTSRLTLIELSTYHGLTLYPCGLAELTSSNSGIVEGLIPTGLRQHSTGRPLANPYPPLAAKVFADRKAANGGVFNFSSYADVYAVVCQIEKDNSTGDFRYHHGVACDFIANYILANRASFLANIAPGTTPTNATALVDDIRSQLKAAGLYEARSLASKVCKYFSEYNSSKVADVFYIDDSFVRESVPHYMKYFFGITLTSSTVEKSSYAGLYEWLSKIHSRVTGGMISKSKFDHLLWYIYRK